MHGNVSEWVADCWNNSYQGAPKNGSVRNIGHCEQRVVRGGSWKDSFFVLWSSTRDLDFASNDEESHRGFRLALDLL